MIQYSFRMRKPQKHYPERAQCPIRMHSEALELQNACYVRPGGNCVAECTGALWAEVLRSAAVSEVEIVPREFHSTFHLPPARNSVIVEDCKKSTASPDSDVCLVFNLPVAIGPSPKFQPQIEGEMRAGTELKNERVSRLQYHGANRFGQSRVRDQLAKDVNIEVCIGNML
jgi:hypothetical protein